MEELITLLKTIGPMSAELQAHLRRIIQKRIYKKGDVILPMGTVCNHIFYIEKGLVRSFYRHGQQEISNWFMLEGDICIAVLSFLRQMPAMEEHVALEDCVCWGISYSELEEAYALFPGFERHGRLITGEYYCRSEERAIDTKLKSALDRYVTLMEKSPNLVLRVPYKYLASYLGVKERTLNEIKKLYSDMKKSSNGKRLG